MTSIPTRRDINVYDSLDERTACAHFLGKSLAQAEALFRENSIYYQEDLMFMGPVAFRYYVMAAIRYIESEAATRDCDMISCFAGLLESRLASEPAELRPVANQLAASCRYIVDHYERFDVTTEIYGDVRGRFMALRESLGSMSEQEGAPRPPGPGHPDR